MPGEKLSSDSDLSELNERLTAGIETCRSVIANYKSLLSDSPGGAPAAEDQGGVGGVGEAGPAEE